MEEYLNYLKDLPPYAIFFTMFLAAFVENIFPPIPGDTVTIIGGALVGFGISGFSNVFISTSLGSIAGFMTLYITGYKLGSQFFKRSKTKVFHPENLEKLETWFNRHGFLVLVLNRFMAGTRSLVSIVAGISKQKWPKVLILSGISVFIWNGLLISAGFYLGKNWQIAENLVKTYSEIITIFIVIIIFALVIYKKRKKSA